MYNNQTSKSNTLHYQSTAGQVGADRNIQNESPSIREAGPIDKASETLGYLNQLDDLAANLRAKLYGRTPNPPDCAEKRQEPPCLEEMMHMICQRSALLVGEMQNILGRL